MREILGEKGVKGPRRKTKVAFIERDKKQTRAPVFV